MRLKAKDKLSAAGTVAVTVTCCLPRTGTYSQYQYSEMFRQQSKCQSQGQFTFPAAVLVSVAFSGNITIVVKETGREAGDVNVYFAAQVRVFLRFCVGGENIRGRVM